MARTRDPVAHAVRRDAFLDSAQRLIQTKGYGLMSIQDVLADLSVSKGAFYHYFDSKSALLEAVVTRMVEDTCAAMAQVVDAPEQPALAKFDAVFRGLAAFKAQRRELIIELMRVWQSDDNVLMREKFRHGVIAGLTPLIASIIRQGRAEGVFDPASPEHTASPQHTAAPEHTARVFMALFMGANEAAVDLFHRHQAGEVTFEEVESVLSTFGDAFERLLGARTGSLRFADRLAVAREWFDVPTSQRDRS